jgi:MFS family permease
MQIGAMTADALWKNRNYRLIFSASAISNLGDGVSALALPWLAALLTRDAMLIAVVAMAGKLPWFLFSLPAGVWTDRVDRRLLMVRADLVRLVLTLGVVGLILQTPALPLPDGAGVGAIWALAAITFFLGTAEVLRDNAAQTVLPSIVAPADLELANGQMWSAETIMGQFIGPPLAGVLIGLGIALPFGFDAVSFAVAAGLVTMMALPMRAVPEVQPFWHEMRDGVRWIRAHPVILRLAIMLGCVNFLWMATLTVMVLYAQDVLGLDAVGYGLLLTVGAAGAVIGGLVAPAIAVRLGMRNSLLVGLGCFAAAYLVLGITSSPIVAGVALFIEGAGAMLWNVVTVSYRQRMIPDAILGRVNSIYRFFGWGTMPLGALAGGAIVTWAEPAFGRAAALHAPYLAAAAGCAAMVGYAFARLRTA